MKRSGDRRWHRFAGAVLAAVLSSGLCVASAGTAAAAPAKGTPIKFGVIATLTGPEGFPEAPQALSAYVKNWNAQGGYKGHPIELLIKDGMASPTTYSTDARSLVLSDGVVGMIALVDYLGFDCIVNNSFYISSAIGVLGGGCPGSYNPKYDFGRVVSGKGLGTSDLSPEIKFAVSQGAKKIGILGFSAVSELVPTFNRLQSYAASISATLVLPFISTPVNPTAADYDGALATLKAEGVDTVLTYEQTPQLLLQEANRQGFGPNQGIRYILGVNWTGPTDAAGLPGDFVLDSVYPWTNKTPAVETAVRLLKGHVSSLDTLAGFGYDAGAELQGVLNNVKGPLTRASFINAMAHTTSVYQPLSPIKLDVVNPPGIPYEGGTILKSVNGVWKQASPFYIIKIKE